MSVSLFLPKILRSVSILFLIFPSASSQTMKHHLITKGANITRFGFYLTYLIIGPKISASSQTMKHHLITKGANITRFGLYLTNLIIGPKILATESLAAERNFGPIFIHHLHHRLVLAAGFGQAGEKGKRKIDF